MSDKEGEPCLLNVWDVTDNNNTWLEIRDYAPTEDEHFCYSFNEEGNMEKRLFTELDSVYFKKLFVAGLVSLYHNTLILTYSWATKAEQEAALLGARLTCCNNKNKLRLYEIKDMRGSKKR